MSISLLRGVVLILLLAFVSHFIHLNHHHPNEVFGDGLRAVLHGGDRKLWLLLLIVSFVLALSHVTNSLQRNIEAIYKSSAFFFFFSRFSVPRSYINIIFRKGIAHPKFCD